ncbi:MAG: PIN domain-containing protein [Zoogloeaceae bacterium]|nr:PIN domain-containing protein [Zoogloeaceae bacterium]
MNDGFLLDSVILIDHFNRIDAATDFLSRQFGRCAISAITRAEVLAGFDDADLPAAIALLDQFRFLPLDRAVADEAARQRRDTRLKLPDAIQAAFAIRHRLRLVTRNSKDFRPEEFDFVMTPYTLEERGTGNE